MSLEYSQLSFEGFIFPLNYAALVKEAVGIIWTNDNQCDHASANLRRNFKAHSGEKSNKCNRGGFSCSQAGVCGFYLYFP